MEAKYRSGTNITAHDAMKQRREVFCIPGDIDSIRSYGANRLIDEGANLVMSPKDIIDILEIDGYIVENKTVEPEYKEVYELIGTIPITANELARLTKKTINEINEILLMLELDEFIKEEGLGKYVVS